MQLKAGYLKGLCQARPKWVNKNNQRRSSDNPGVQAEELKRYRERKQRDRVEKCVTAGLPQSFLK